MNFLRFLAWAFYWMRLELAALEQPHVTCTVSRELGRWRVTLGENVATAREAWQAIRLMLEGTPEDEPLELSPEAIGKQADALAEQQDVERAEIEAARQRDALERERLAELAPPAPGPVLSNLERAHALERELASADVVTSADSGAGETLGDEDARLELEAAPTLIEEPEPRTRRGF